MEFRRRKVMLARLGAAIGSLCGVIGFFGGLAELPWRLGVTGWFNGGILMALVSLVVLVDTALTPGNGQEIREELSQGDGQAFP